jgi:dienelactone hydrolase
MRRVVCLLLFLFLGTAVGQDFTNGKFDVKPSWEKAEVFVPGRLFNTNVRELPKAEPLDVVLYMHSSVGIKADETQWASLLNEMGLVVVMPDSYAIKGRMNRSNPYRNPAGLAGTHSQEELGAIRVTELVYAINQLKELPNVRRIFLMGFSEGSVIVLAGFRDYEKDGVNVPAITRAISGVISISSFCAGPVRVPDSVPLLLVNYETDPQFPRMSNSACVEKTKYRKSTSIVVLKGDGHEAGRDSVAKASVKEFIGALIGK